MRVKTKMYIATALSIVLLVTLAMVVLLSNMQLNRAEEERKVVIEVVSGVLQLNTITQNYERSPAKLVESQWQLRHDDLTRVLVLAKLDDPVENSILMQIIKDHNAAKEIFIELGDVAGHGENEQLLYDRLETQWHRVVSGADKLRNSIITSSEELRQRTNWVMGSFVVALVAVFVVKAYSINKSVSQPIEKLVRTMSAISAGHLDVEIEPKLKTSKDEIGDLAFHFDTMKKKIKTNTEELARVNEELKRKDRLKDEFISIASHELRTPIVPILGFADFVREGKVDQERAWDIVLRNARRLYRLSNDILDASRIESGDLKYAMQKVKINDLILDAVNGQKALLSEEVSIQLDLDKDVEIIADKNRILQVLTNVISNAVKFTKKGMITVEVHCCEDRNYVEVRVSDTGGGIPRHILSSMFDKFVTDTSEEQNTHGAGLGLYICKAIIAAHQGEISAMNNSIGGATFKIVLPLRHAVHTLDYVRN